jgi:hypothetical protein
VKGVCDDRGRALARFSQYGPINDAFMATGDWAKAIRSVIADQVPAGIVVVQCTSR